ALPRERLPRPPPELLARASVIEVRPGLGEGGEQLPVQAVDAPPQGGQIGGAVERAASIRPPARQVVLLEMAGGGDLGGEEGPVSAGSSPCSRPSSSIARSSACSRSGSSTGRFVFHFDRATSCMRARRSRISRRRRLTAGGASVVG